MQPAQHAGQRLGHGRVFVGNVRRNGEHVAFHDPPRYTDVLRIGAVVEEQVLAKIFLVLGAEETHAAGRGVQSHHAHSFAETAHSRADLLDHSRQFVPEQGRRHNHAGVITALVDLQVGAASERDLHFDQDLTFPHAGNGHLLDLYVFLAVQDGSRHFSIHFEHPSQALPG